MDGSTRPTEPERFLTPEEHPYGPRHGAHRRLGAFATVAALAFAVVVLTQNDSTEVRTESHPAKALLAVGRASTTTLPDTTGTSASGSNAENAQANTATTAAAGSTPTSVATGGPSAPGSPSSGSGSSPSGPGAPPPVDDGGPVSLSITVSPGRPSAGVPARVTFDSAGDASAFGFDLGDGTNQPMTAPSCGAAFGGPKTVDHIWGATGSFTVTLAVSGARCRADGSQPQYQTVTKTLVIAVVDDSDTGGNGPKPPKAAGSQPSKSGTDVSLTVSGTDADGFGYAAAVDWGDGTPQSVQLVPLSGCQDDGGTPLNGAASFPFTHHYSSAGQQHITVTFFSTGCDGRSAQSDERTYLFKI